MLELLRQVNAPWGDALTGKDLSDVVLVTSQDGYKVAFSLGEIDPGTAKGQVLVADRADGAVLDARSGRAMRARLRTNCRLSGSFRDAGGRAKAGP